VRRHLFAAFVLAAGLLTGCGDDGKPDRTIAFVRTTAITEQSHEAFLDELALAGWKVGDNLTVLLDDPATSLADEDAVAAAVDEIVDEVDLFVALSTAAAAGTLRVTGELPVLVLANDPVGSGLVENPRSPEANLTGLSFRVPADRTLDVARQVIGGRDAVGFLWPGGDVAAEPIVRDMRAAAGNLGVSLIEASFADDADVERAVGELAASGAEVVILANAPGAVRATEAIEAAFTAAGIPVVANTNVNTWALAVLAPDNVAAFRQLGRQAVRLLEGSAVNEVPLEDPGEFNLRIRTNVADRLSIVLSEELLEQADQLEE